MIRTVARQETGEGGFSLVELVVALVVVALLVVVAVNVYTFNSASAELTDSLKSITAHDPAATDRESPPHSKWP